MITLEAARAGVDRLSAEVTSARAVRDQFLELAADAVAASDEHYRLAQITDLASVLLQSYSEAEQEALRSRIEMLTSRGLELIFGKRFDFKVVVRQVRGQAAMEFRIGGSDPLDSNGGGVVNVVSLVLRLVVVALTPSLGDVVVLDEPFAQLSAAYLPGMGTFIRELADASGVQLLIVSHESEIAAVADMAYRIDGGRVV